MKYKILYVDDEVINLEAFELAFIFDKNFEIKTAISGIEGLKILQQNNDIKAVISDMQMPVMDGLTFIKKARDFYNKIPYFILSGYSETPEVKKAQKEGIIIDYIMKPYDKEVLDECLIKAISLYFNN